MGQEFSILSDRNTVQSGLCERELIFICVGGKSRVTSGFRNSLIQDSLSLFPPLGSTWLILQTSFLHMMVSALAGAPESPLSRKGPFSVTALVRKSQKDSNWLA